MQLFKCGGVRLASLGEGRCQNWFSFHGGQEQWGINYYKVVFHSEKSTGWERCGGCLSFFYHICPWSWAAHETRTVWVVERICVCSLCLVCVCVSVQWEPQYSVIAVWTWHPCCCSTGWDSPSLIKYWRSENSLSNQISQGIPLIPLNSRFLYSPQEVFYQSKIKEEDCSSWGSDEAMKKRGSS